MCPRMLGFVAKFCEQISQKNDRFSLCVVKWAFRYFNWANSLKHFSHRNFDVLLCAKTCVRKLEKFLHRFWQMKHSLYFRARYNWSSVRFLYIASSSLSEASASDSQYYSVDSIRNREKLKTKRKFDCFIYTHLRFGFDDFIFHRCRIGRIIVLHINQLDDFRN